MTFKKETGRDDSDCRQIELDDILTNEMCAVEIPFFFNSNFRFYLFTFSLFLPIFFSHEFQFRKTLRLRQTNRGCMKTCLVYSFPCGSPSEPLAELFYVFVPLSYYSQFNLIINRLCLCILFRHLCVCVVLGRCVEQEINVSFWWLLLVVMTMTQRLVTISIQYLFVSRLLTELAQFSMLLLLLYVYDIHIHTRYVRYGNRLLNPPGNRSPP